jgi:hypothetical protein
MERNEALPGTKGAGAPIVFTWLASAGAFGFAQLISGQILIFKLEGSPATLALLGIAVYFGPVVALACSLAGAASLSYAAWHRAPGPWRKLRRATWALALPAALIAGALLFSIAEGTEINGRPAGIGLSTMFAWAPLVILGVLGFALLIDAITRLTPAGRSRALPYLAIGAAVSASAAIFVPYVVG